MRALTIRPVLLATFTLAACTVTPDPAAGGGGGTNGTLYVNIGTRASVFALDLGSGAAAKLGDGSDPCLTPEGTLLVDDGNNIFETDTTFAMHRVFLTFNSDLERSNNGFHDYQLSRDGKRIAYITNDRFMYVANRSDGAVTARFEPPGVTDAWDRPSWTPDGRIVAAGGFGNPGLFLSDVGLTKMTRFDQNLARPTMPAISPDGTKVAFILNQRVHVVKLDGTGFTRLDPGDTEDLYPTWSPDGTQIAYRVSGRIKIMPAAGGAAFDLFDRFPDVAAQYFIFSGRQFAWK